MSDFGTPDSPSTARGARVLARAPEGDRDCRPVAATEPSPVTVRILDAMSSRFSLGERASGLLVHPTSLPGPHGCGDAGLPSARFAAWLARAGQRWWQLLPVGPVGYGNSPYSALSAFAGSPLLVSLDALVPLGLLRAADLRPPAPLPDARVDYPAAAAFRLDRLRRAFAAFRALPARSRLVKSFHSECESSSAWLADWALFAALKDAHGGRAWTAWAPELRDRRKPALRAAAARLADELDFRRFEQWLFTTQWRALREACAAQGVALLGDAPIFVAHDSADVWSGRELFKLGARGEPTVVAGVPPDYFSATGQRWGNPLYRWATLRRSGYAWWLARLRLSLERFDALRLDHFIGFTRAWEIPAASPIATRGKFVPGPGRHFFRAVEAALGGLPFVAEDLGLVTPAVAALRDEFGLPGLRLLQFAFGTDPQAPTFAPHAYPRRAVAYTGTHDNDTTLGWFHDRGGPPGLRTPAQCEKERRAALEYLGRDDDRDVHWAMIREVLKSPAGVAIVPLQDPLGLGSKARMNLPGTVAGNWEWRVPPGSLTASLAARLARLARVYGRAPGAA